MLCCNSNFAQLHPQRVSRAEEILAQLDSYSCISIFVQKEKIFERYSKLKYVKIFKVKLNRLRIGRTQFFRTRASYFCLSTVEQYCKKVFIYPTGSSNRTPLNWQFFDIEFWNNRISSLSPRCKSLKSCRRVELRNRKWCWTIVSIIAELVPYLPPSAIMKMRFRALKTLSSWEFDGCNTWENSNKTRNPFFPKISVILQQFFHFYDHFIPGKVFQYPFSRESKKGKMSSSFRELVSSEAFWLS